MDDDVVVVAHIVTTNDSISCLTIWLLVAKGYVHAASFYGLRFRVLSGWHVGLIEGPPCKRCAGAV